MRALAKAIDEHKDEKIDIRDFFNQEYDEEAER